MSAEEAALLRSMVALVRQRYGLDDIEAAAYVVDMPSRIKALEAENAALRLRPIPDWAGMETPWPLPSVLERLCEAADHLHNDHNCDAHGWETACEARDSARRILPNLQAGLAEMEALRLRVVPALEWEPRQPTGEWDVLVAVAEAGKFALRIRCVDGYFVWHIRHNGVTICSSQGKGLDAEAEAKSACEAAFLRLVGCKNG